MGKLKAIWVKRFKLGPMDPVESAILVEQKGLEGNANQGGNRQVTIIEEEIWHKLMDEAGGNLDPAARRANLMVTNFPLKDSRKRILQIGECRILIKGETKPCERMDEALDGLRENMYADWKGGAYGRVLTGGMIRVGDAVKWEAFKNT